MPTEEPEVQPLHFVQHTVHTIQTWPQRTLIAQSMLDKPHAWGMTVDGDTVVFELFNGNATYTVRRDLPRRPGGVWVADLVEGTDKVTSRQVARRATPAEGE